MKTTKTYVTKMFSALSGLLPALRALVEPHGGKAEIRSFCKRNSVRVTIPNPASSFDLTIDAEVSDDGSEWVIKSGSGSWDATDHKTLALLAERVGVMAACDRILSTIKPADLL